MEAEKFKNYKSITLADMAQYIEDNAPKDKAWFKRNAYDARTKKEAVKQYDKNGNPIMYQVKDKNGKLKFDKNGNPVMRHKVKMEKTSGGEEMPVFNLLKAKRAFYEKYFPDYLPQAEAKKKKSDILEAW